MFAKLNQFAGIALVFVISLFLLAGLGMVLYHSARASADFTVNTTTDTHDADPGDGTCADSNGACSLRAAIEETNALSGGDIIDLPGGTYLLIEGELWISDTLTLTGEAMTTTIVDGQDISRVFDIENLDDNTLIDVSLSNLTIQNGNSGEPLGGGIRTSENLLIDHAKIQQNRSNNDGGGLYTRALGRVVLSNTQVNDNVAPYSAGGGILNQALKLIVINCVIRNNSSGYGGGINNGSNLTVINTMVDGNISYYQGGGISNAGTMTVTNSVVQLNTVTRDVMAFGAGIHNYGSMTISDSVIQNNISMSNGGGISNRNAEYAFIESSIIRDNSANDDGGGIYNETIPGIHIENSEIYGNSGVDGGGIYNDQSIMTITSSHLYSNTATYNGGGIYSRDVEPPLESSNYVLINASVIDSNAATGQYEEGGGGLFIESGAITITHSTISRNVAEGGGGGINSYFGKVYLLNSTVSENISSRGGGGILAGGYFFKIENSTVSGNLAESDGGGIYVREFVTVTLNNSTIVDNNADADGNGYGDGGGLYIGDVYWYYVYFRNTILANNLAAFAPDCGGGESLNSLDYNLIEDPTDCSITGNTSNNILGLDPNLGTLAENGGNTVTHALLPGSPAIDIGTCTDIDGQPITEDQRGFPRPFGENCDIGAYEKDGSEPTPVPTPTPTPTCVPHPTSTPGATPTPLGAQFFLPVIQKGSGC